MVQIREKLFMYPQCFSEVRPLKVEENKYTWVKLRWAVEEVSVWMICTMEIKVMQLIILIISDSKG